jgi:Fe-S oxidoreductase
MDIEQYRNDMETCRRCSACKFIPLEKIKGFERVNVCPSISRYEFHTYSGGGRMVLGTALLSDRVGYSEKLMEVMYNCQLCGACDISCKYSMDMEVQESINAMRIKAVEDGHTNDILDKLISSLRKRGTMVVGNQTKRGEWATGLNVKDITQEKAEVAYFAGCRTAYDTGLWKIARMNVEILQKAGVEIGIAGENEICCGGRAYQMGYEDDFLRQAKINVEMLKQAGVKTLVTGCAECYQAFKVLYDKFQLKGDLEVLHSTEYFARLIEEGKIKPVKAINLRVTYQDPCHLGRLGEPWIHWSGKQLPGHMRLFDPPKQFRRGTHGSYTAPRRVLESIPGLTVVEMERTKEYAWCCGAGGGVKESNPEFAAWTARERIKEATWTGAEALVTACPGCLRNFRESQEKESQLGIYDVTELLEKAME